jgi:hypothetical protein
VSKSFELSRSLRSVELGALDERHWHGREGHAGGPQGCGVL